MIFLTTKVLVLTKIGGDFPPKSVKRGIFSVRGTSMVTIKQRKSDARGQNVYRAMSLKCWEQWLYHVLLVSLVRAVADVFVGILYLL